MNDNQDVQQQAIQAILGPPDPKFAQSILSKLCLDKLPSPEHVYKEIEDKILLPRTSLPEHWLPSYQIHWEHHLEVPTLLVTEPSPSPSTLSFVRTGLEGRVTGCIEVPVSKQGTGLSSTSLDRAPAPLQSFVRGKSGHVPFWPGGLDEALLPENEIESAPKGLRTVPPGFSRGLRDGTQDVEGDIIALDVGARTSDKAAELHDKSANTPQEGGNGEVSHGPSEIDDLLPTSRSQLRPVVPVSKPLRRTAVQKREWAHVVDVRKPMTHFRELVPEMARKYPFELDTFQKEAVFHLEMGDSVFVAAHTSAGKTVVAEYAIALAAKHMTRAIYTSPIKALSNQKFRDFKQTFSSSSVGILTGDVQINPEANCLIMTTEILRSMLYKGADLIRDVEFVIFDEVHYVNDAERGVVWEEVIIMLPEHVSIILLSATVPNTKEFADWVGRTKKKDIYVISTPSRPVPLEHYLYAGRDIHKIVDSKGQFLSTGYKDAGEALRRKQDKEREAAGLPPVQRLGARAAAPQRGQRGVTRGRGGGARGGGGAPGGPRTFHQPDKNLYVHLVGFLRKSNLLPVVVFTFSKRRCEENAATLTNVDLSSSSERSEVHVTIEKALARLKGTDKKLPQIGRMRDLLSRGIGVHHGGLLPIVKEVVEILFARGLVKVLFATETFAMGVNMPAKCVVFSGIRKHDGKSFRTLEAGEYTQMAGRAGRRGLDTTGTVIITASDEVPEITTLQTMMLGTPMRLQSQFRLTYNMILNLLRVEALKVEEMIKRSFSENASQKLLPDQQRKVIENEKLLSTMPKLDCEVCLSDIRAYYDTSAQIVDLNATLLSLAAASPQGSRTFGQGRIVILRDNHFRNNAAVIVKAGPAQDKIKTFFILALSNKETKAKKINPEAQPVPPIWPPQVDSVVNEDFVYEYAVVPITSIALVTSRTLKADFDQIERAKITPMNNAVAALNEIAKEWVAAGSIPEADWNRVRALEFQEALRTRNELTQKLASKACLLCESFKDHYAILHGEMTLRANIDNLKLAISDQNLELIPDYEQRIAVLQELKFIDANSTVLLKGRVACEINSADELILTEVILENMLATYEPEEVVALLSCFVFKEKTDVEPAVTPRLEEGRAAILGVAERVGAVEDRNKVASPDSESRLKFGLIEVVYEWAKGMPFEQIMLLTDVAEGTIVRVITRLDETCREVRDAARVIGDASLMKKMEEAQVRIKRDIVFAASLYF